MGTAAETVSALNLTWIAILIITVFVCQALYELIRFHDREKTHRWIIVFSYIALIDIIWSVAKTVEVFNLISNTTYQATLQIILPLAMVGKAALIMTIIDAARRATDEYHASLDDNPPSA